MLLLCLVFLTATAVLGNDRPTSRGAAVRGGPDLWRRQATSSTYDFWWPFPPATAEGTTPTAATQETAPASVISILISTIPASATASALSLQSTTAVQALPASTSTSASASASSTSSSYAATPAPTQTQTQTQNQTTNAHAAFDVHTIAPAVAGGVGFLLLILAAWVLWGVCTRRPRVAGKDGGGLIAGPAYSQIGRGGVGDVEHAFIYRGGAGSRGRGRGVTNTFDEEGALYVPKNGDTGAGGGYRWPSYGFPPDFDSDSPSKHAHATSNRNDENINCKNADDELQTLLLVAHGHARRPSLSHSVGGGSEYTSLARARSDATSAALHALSAAPSEDGHENTERTGSLRRALIARIEEERVWTESVRVARARGAEGVVGIFPAVKGDARGGSSAALVAEGVVGAGEGADGGKRREGKNEGGRRRKGHVRADSDVRIGEPASAVLRSPPTRQHTRSPPRNPRSPRTRPPTSPPPLARPPPARGRRSTARLKRDEGGEEEEDRYTRRPTRRSASRGGNSSTGGSRSASRGPVARRARGQSRARAGGSKREGEWEAPPAFLPQSPAQLMSPALARQMCFTPIPSPDPTSRNAGTGFSAMNPQEIPSAKGSKHAERDGRRSARRIDTEKDRAGDKDKDKDVPPLPLPDALRGRLRKKRSAAPLAGAAPDGRHGQAEEAGAAQRVDDIMAAGWGARGLGPAGMRSLSPTGFGRAPAGGG
ncbi:hypothetical protein HYPSUDRAFT_334533 [Hypholoma sublateritium FD-334 SS-4]|uniref:Uncharacterized protein n=1 Tax=Hypholoma sublateritium (strain FD-334 SS-4) TaxID=945553 RepID=A0A0D2N9P3_HYPSF|nr:hypothetical protein HYPSUDRAFT_334533 [Hypholoma sublateritium FD-334 SS-4]